MHTIVERLARAAARYEQLIYETADYIWQHPEPGYREWNTSAYLAERFEALGYALTKPGDIPGFYTDIDTGRQVLQQELGRHLLHGFVGEGNQAEQRFLQDHLL